MIALLIFISLCIWYCISQQIKQNNRIAGLTDQQRYGPKYSVGKIIAYKKTWYGWRKK